MTRFWQRLRPQTTALLLLLAASVFSGLPVLAADLVIYSDALDAGWSDWSWDTTRNFSSATPVKSGSAALSARFDAAWAGLYLHPSIAVSTTGYSGLGFWIHGGSSGGQQLRIVANGNEGATVTVNATAGEWTKVTIPFSSLGNPASLTDLYWQDSKGAAQPAFYLDDISLVASTQPPAAIQLSIDAATGRHPISPDIYGMNFASEGLASELRLPVRRWGGNSTTRYNWQTNMHSTGSDWYFENIPDGPATATGSATDLFVEQDRRTGARTLLTIPLIGWTPSNDSPRSHPYACGFKVSRYGQQKSVDTWDSDCGNGVNTSDADITGNNPADTSSAITPSFVSNWLAHLTSLYGTASQGGVAYYNLDNEPMLWNSTHRDVHPTPASYDELRDRTWQYAAALKGADSGAKTLGPVLWGWCAYFYSALDDCQPGDDFTSHGNAYFVPWYLQQMSLYESQHGLRLLDYLDLHYYPQASNVSLSTAGNASIQALRLRTTRSLWDPTYVDESWINDMGLEGGVVRLIPRMKEWVDTYYPGTRLAITEYNWGGLESVNGALAQADVLGIFGREGLDLATLWSPPDSGQPGAYAFRMFLNYDGARHGFGDTGINATSSDQGTLAVYAAQRSSDNALTVLVINKSSGALSAPLSISGVTPGANAALYRYSGDNTAAIVHLADQPVTQGGFTATYPANSLSLFIIPVSTPSRTLSLTLNGTGSGTVSADPGGLTWNGATGTARYPSGTQVTLTAEPLAGSGSIFGDWGGACSSGTNSCALTMSVDRSVQATFNLAVDFTATPTSGALPLNVCFSDTSPGSVSAWQWNFGDTAAATAQNPCHVYSAAGTYTVALNATLASGAVNRTRTGLVTVAACENQPIKRVNGSNYSRLNDALAAASGGGALWLQALEFAGDITIAATGRIDLTGGYNCAFTTHTLSSAINGSLTLTGGSLVPDGVVIY